MTRRGLPDADQHAITFAVATHGERRDLADAGPPTPGPGWRSVRLQVGSTIRSVGAIPPATSNAEFETLMVEKLEKALAAAIVDVTVDLRQFVDVQRIVRVVVGSPGAGNAIAGTQHDPTGPLIRALRIESRMTLRALAAAMERDEGTVRKWERGEPTKIHVGDVGRAARALGYSEGAVHESAWWTQEDLRQKGYPRPIQA